VRHGDGGGERVSEIEGVLRQMHARLNDIRAWLMALTGLVGAQFAAIVGLAVTPARR
jgi:hypothetical protein